ncbi:MAG: Eco57I restriction-modification methylase domain-containing protein, partial [Methanomicrobiales archaeon]|nr:Eco57I restriction-modification methylase domain-containing protein [Methanomicrobiales archaeon]
MRQESLKEQKKYFETHYEVYQGTADLYAYFIEKGISLLRPKGIFSYIVANKWMRANYGKPLRKYLLTKQIEEIVDFGDLPVFKTAITYPCIIRIS